MGKRVEYTLRLNRSQLKAIDRSIVSAVKGAGKVARNLVLERLSKRGLTDNQLASLDHPYAKRHGSIQASNGSPKQYIGKRTGSIASSLGEKFSSRSSGRSLKLHTAIVGFFNPPKHAIYIFRGTRIMLSRNPLAVIPQNHKLIINTIEKGIKI